MLQQRIDLALLARQASVMTSTPDRSAPDVLVKYNVESFGLKILSPVMNLLGSIVF